MASIFEFCECRFIGWIFLRDVREGRTPYVALEGAREADPNEACKLLVTSSKIGTDGQDIKRGGSPWAQRAGQSVGENQVTSDDRYYRTKRRLAIVI